MLKKIVKITKNKHQIVNKLQKTSTKIQINYNIQKFNNQNNFIHLPAQSAFGTVSRFDN